MPIGLCHHVTVKASGDRSAQDDTVPGDSLGSMSYALRCRPGGLKYVDDVAHESTDRAVQPAHQLRKRLGAILLTEEHVCLIHDVHAAISAATLPSSMYNRLHLVSTHPQTPHTCLTATHAAETAVSSSSLDYHVV
jgi:hypothetical protein